MIPQRLISGCELSGRKMEKRSGKPIALAVPPLNDQVAPQCQILDLELRRIVGACRGADSAGWKPPNWCGRLLFKLGDDIMYIERNGSRILAAYLDEQFPGQEWLPIESRALQVFLATAPSVGRGCRRPTRRVAGDWSLPL